MRFAARLFVHVLDDGCSCLFELVSEELRLIRRFEQTYSFTIDRTGRLLARNCQNGKVGDLILNGKGEILSTLALGHYDCFNHYLRVDGANGFYFLRGSPASSHLHKRLCLLGEDGAVSDLGPWDPEFGHFMEATACMTTPGILVRGYRVHDYNPSAGDSYVECLELDSMNSRWRASTACPPVALHYMAANDCVVVATLDGRVATLDAHTGNLLEEVWPAINGMQKVVMSLDSIGHSVAAGTVDGTVLNYRVTR